MHIFISKTFNVNCCITGTKIAHKIFNKCIVPQEICNKRDTLFDLPHFRVSFHNILHDYVVLKVFNRDRVYINYRIYDNV